jgi:hypothetical protein
MPLAIASAALLLAGLYFLISASRGRRRSTTALHWPQAGGVVASSALIPHHDAHGEATYEPSVAYRYEANGRVYSGSRIQVGATRTPSRREAEARLFPYPPGISVTVHHDPDDPSAAVLEPRTAGTGPLTAAGLALLVLSAIATFAAIVSLA